jgi:chromosome segregation ATPase
MSEIEKIRDFISRHESRIADLEKSILRARDTFSSESRKVAEVAARVNAELEDWDRKMRSRDDDISRLEEKRQGLKSEISQFEQKSKEVEKKRSSAVSETVSTQKEIARAQNTLDQYKTKIETLNVELEKLSKETTDLRDNLEKMKQSNEKEFEDLEKQRNEFQQKTKELSEKQPITHFLLNEAESEPPEVMIVAQLIKENGQILIDDLKKATKINSATAARTIELLEQKGIVSKVDKDNIRLLKK